MQPEDFAKIFKFKGINVQLDEASIAFAVAWGNVVLGDYLMTEGENKFNLGKQILQEEEKAHSSERDEASGGLIIQ